MTIINHNLSANKISNSLNRVNSKFSKSLEKLSTGLKINRAADDAAGLSISAKLRALSRGLNQAEANISDGLSMISTADGYMSGMHDILKRIRELSVEAANDTMTDEDRWHIQKEVDHLYDEMKNIFSNAEFNTIPIFDQNIRWIELPDTGGIKGDTTIVEPYPLQIISNKNDSLSFRLNNKEPIYSIQVKPPGNYTKEQIVNKLNAELARVGLGGVPDSSRVWAGYSGDSIVFHSPDDYIDSFSGNMFNIDGYDGATSILFDNIMQGSRTSAYVTGYKNILGTTPPTTIYIGEETKELKLKINGTDYTITLDEGAFNTVDYPTLLDMLNEKFSEAGLPVEADFAGSVLRLKHTSFNPGDTLLLMGSKANEVLFYTNGMYSWSYGTNGTSPTSGSAYTNPITSALMSRIPDSSPGNEFTITAGSNTQTITLTTNA